MAIQLCNHGIYTGSGGSGGGSVTIDTTTGSPNLIVLIVGEYSGGSLPTPSENRGNGAPTALTAQSQVAESYSRIFYWKNPTTNASHQFTVSGANCFATFVVATFSGVDTSSPADQENGATGVTIASLATGSITPSVNGALIFCGGTAGQNQTGTFTVSGETGFTSIDQQAYQAGTAESVCAFYKIQTTAAAVNPTINWTGSTTISAAMVIADFKPAAGASSAAFTSEGTFAPVWSSASLKSALFTSEGTFVAAAIGGSNASALFRGEGVFSVGISVNAAPAFFSGEGVFSPATAQIIGVSALFTGEGIFSPRRQNPVSPMDLYWYQLTVGTYAPLYYKQLDDVVRQLCTNYSVTPPSSPWYNSVTGTLVNSWVSQVDRSIRSICTVLSSPPPASQPTNLTRGTVNPQYFSDLDGVIRTLCTL